MTRTGRGQDARGERDTALADELLAAYTASRALWHASRGGQTPHEIAVPAGQAYAGAERAVTAAARLRLVEVERDQDGTVTAIRAAGGPPC